MAEEFPQSEYQQQESLNSEFYDQELYDEIVAFRSGQMEPSSLEAAKLRQKLLFRVQEVMQMLDRNSMELDDEPTGDFANRKKFLIAPRELLKEIIEAKCDIDKIDAARSLANQEQ